MPGIGRIGEASHHGIWPSFTRPLTYVNVTYVIVGWGGIVPRHETVALPAVIQGGMGVAVSSWPLARAVSAAGQLGVVSGTALDAVLARRLQDGDPGGHMRAALEAFPVPEIAGRVLHRYLRAAGRPPGTPYAPVPRLRVGHDQRAQELTVVANFAEVWLAKRGHQGMVGVNYLDKIRMALPAAAYGAMLAGVDVVLAGAGIPRELPALLRALARHEPVSVPVDVAGAPAGQRYAVSLDPAALSGQRPPPLKRPVFLAVVSSHVLAEYLARDPLIRPDGFVVEGPTAGGHNAPPRGRLTLDEDGQPRYSSRDDADLTRLAALGLPFWLAGSYDTPARLKEARACGATGIQVGTLFALCHESGLRADLRSQLLGQARDGTLRVRTDPAASPAGFPFKIAELPGTLADAERYKTRPRLCDLGHLRVPYARPNGGIGYRCPGEPVHTYLRKGGDAADTVGRSCLCNALLANVGLGQTRHGSGYAEDPLVTLGSGFDGVSAMLQHRPAGWSAAQALTWLLADPGAATAHQPEQLSQPGGAWSHLQGRHAEQAAREALQDTRVVLVNGDHRALAVLAGGDRRGAGRVHRRDLRARGGSPACVRGQPGRVRRPDRTRRLPRGDSPAQPAPPGAVP